MGHMLMPAEHSGKTMHSAWYEGAQAFAGQAFKRQMFLCKANGSKELRKRNYYLMSYCFSFLRSVPRFNPKTIDALL